MADQHFPEMLMMALKDAITKVYYIRRKKDIASQKRSIFAPIHVILQGKL